ncbi:MAG: hypothetical protein H3C68_03170 [Deltaproteobacteria bacterium]|nr:hypothetical protein [Deltaproteobacteria bacterium]MBZ0219728.1 hypothetical protein [Deltaproteobacteria bacterium]
MGCIVLAPDRAKIPCHAEFECVVTVQDVEFFNYTALTLRPQRVHELYHRGENETNRFKEHVPVLSNMTGVKRGEGAQKALFLSREIPSLAADDQAESLFLSDNALHQLTGDQPDALSRELNPQSAICLYLSIRAMCLALYRPPGSSGHLLEE